MTLQQFFAALPRAAVAFSGGTDSALVLWAARQYGCDVRAYYDSRALRSPPLSWPMPAAWHSSFPCR